MGQEDEQKQKKILSENSRSTTSTRNRAMESLSLEINKYPRDLLQRFMSSTSVQQFKQENIEEDEDENEIELNLGLSLGGRFGVDKTSKGKLTRSSSVAGSIPLIREHDALFNINIKANSSSSNKQAQVLPSGNINNNYPVLMRTSSLPTETEEEWRKRKEMQTLRRMEAKRRRSEKQKNLIRGGDQLNLDEKGLNRGGSNTNNWVPPSWSNRNFNKINSNNATTLQGFIGGTGQQQGSQGSVESQGGSSSGISEMDSKPVQGTSSGGEARSPARAQSLQDRSSQEAVGSSGSRISEKLHRTSSVDNPSRRNLYRTSSVDNPSRRLDTAEMKGKEIGSNAVEDMPCVFTIGDGPNGRKVEGILYKYGKGEEVRIMCVCHGSFLSPAEFVKHAGGRDVDHPLRHIVVNTSAASSLL